MTKTICCCVVALAFAGPASAEDKPAAPAAAAPAAGAPDMSKMGPMSRPVKKEDKKGVDELYKAMDEHMKKGDAEAAADLVDFPVIMLSDDSTGAAKYFSATRDQWVAMMKPFVTNMPKDLKMTHFKHSATFLSDTLAVVVEENGMSMGKTKGKWKSASIVTLKDGKWKFKEMAEAGWGDMPPPPATPGTTKTPATTLPPPPPPVAPKK
jgi:hypothetical protein